MPYVEVEGVLKKVACGPCIRGHRSSKCEHHDRVMIEVRKPGRPLSSCPHPPGSCTCSRVVINYTVPKKHACPGSQPTQTPAAGAGTSRVSKTRSKRSATVVNAAGIEKALKVEDGEPSAPVSADPLPINISSSDVSPASSHTSSGERDNGAPRRRLSFTSAKWTNPNQPPITNGERTQAQPISSGAEPLKPKGSCCQSKAQPEPQPAVKSCCSSKSSNAQSSNLPGVAQHQQGPFGHGNQPLLHKSATFPSVTPEEYMFSQGMQLGNDMGMSPPGFFGHAQSNLVLDQHFQAANGLGIHSAPENNAAPHSMSDCNCGDGCLCLGCAAHPRNKTTTDYILEMNQYMMEPSEPAGQPSFSQMGANGVNGYAQGNHQNFSFHNQMNALNDQQAYYMQQQLHQQQQQQQLRAAAQNDFNSGLARLGYPQQQQQRSDSRQWQMNMTRASSSSQATPTQELERFSIYSEPSQSPLVNGNGTMSSYDGRNGGGNDGSAGQSPEGTSPVLSPSSFFIQSLELPSCTDTSGTCQCGDGCACVGCLTHGGHNGVVLLPEENRNGPMEQFPQAAANFQEQAFADSGATNGHNGHNGPSAYPVPQAGSSYSEVAYMSHPVNVAQSSNAYRFPVSTFGAAPS